VFQALSFQHSQLARNLLLQLAVEAELQGIQRLAFFLHMLVKVLREHFDGVRARTRYVMPLSPSSLLPVNVCPVLRTPTASEQDGRPVSGPDHWPTCGNGVAAGSLSEAFTQWTRSCRGTQAILLSSLAGAGGLQAGLRC